MQIKLIYKCGEPTNLLFYLHIEGGGLVTAFVFRNYLKFLSARPPYLINFLLFSKKKSNILARFFLEVWKELIDEEFNKATLEVELILEKDFISPPPVKIQSFLRGIYLTSIKKNKY